MALANKTKYALLGALNMAPMSGYDIKKFSDNSIAHFWNENYARIYPVLKEMESERLVNKESRQNEGRPLRNVYTITAKGKEEFDQWLIQPPEERRLREELLLKLFFSENVPKENLVEKIKAEKIKNQQYIGEYLKIEQCLKTAEDTKDAPGLPLWLVTLNFGKHFREAIIKWCDETLLTLETMNEKQSK